MRVARVRVPGGAEGRGARAPPRVFIARPQWMELRRRSGAVGRRRSAGALVYRGPRYIGARPQRDVTAARAGAHCKQMAASREHGCIAHITPGHEPHLHTHRTIPFVYYQFHTTT